MKPIVTPGEMLACDRAAISAGTSGEVLMDRAGAAVARAAVRMMGGAYGRRVEILCGKGSNGGDGLAAARHLRGIGACPRLGLLHDPSSFSADAALHWRRLSGLGVPMRKFPRLADADLVMDALFGTGLAGALREDAARWASEVNASQSAVLAVDIPSGVEGATGAVRGEAVRADLTVTMAALKVGLVYGRGAVLAGTVEVADIGIPVSVSGASWSALDDGDARAWKPDRERDAHKWSVGSVLVVAGSRGMAGAGVLAASTALRARAGTVVLAAPSEVLADLEAHPDLTEVMTVSHEDVPELLPRFSAVAIGPGLRTGERQRELVEGVLTRATVPVVVDADGLNNIGSEVLVRREAPTIVTPHEAELRRLRRRDLEDPLDLVPKLAAEWGTVVLLKGPTTLVASPTGECALNLTGTPDLATAGTGDVLTGLVASLASQGLEPWRAAALGAHLHGLAGRGARRARDVRDAL